MSGLPFGLIDVCFVGILVISGILAYIRGFVREVLAVAAWVGAAVITLYGYPHLQPIVRDHIENRMVADLTAGGALFIVSMIALTAIAHVIGRSVRESAASSFDRSMGFAFGVLRGVVLVSLLYLGAVWFWDGRDKLPEAITEARTFPLIEGSADILLALVPESARESTERATGLAREKVDEARKAEQTLRGLIQPKPESQPETQGGPGQSKSGYGQSERNEMQRLIESKQ